MNRVLEAESAGNQIIVQWGPFFEGSIDNQDSTKTLHSKPSLDLYSMHVSAWNWYPQSVETE